MWLDIGPSRKSPVVTGQFSGGGHVKTSINSEGPEGGVISVPIESERGARLHIFQTHVKNADKSDICGQGIQIMSLEKTDNLIQYRVAMGHGSDLLVFVGVLANSIYHG
jgi:hypothetical protein